MRTPSATSATSSDAPLRVTECTVAVIASMNVDAPSFALKRTVVVLRKVSGPVVRSSATS